MGQYYGETVSAAQTSEDRKFLPVGEKRTRPPFRLMVHPKRPWRWDDVSKSWLPELGHLVISAGVQGVGLTPSGQEDTSAARAHYTARGWIILENGDGRFDDILPGGVYLHRWAARPRGFAYGCAWERPEEIGNDVVWDVDRDLEREYHEAVRDRILGGPPTIREREQWIKQQEKVCRRLLDKHASRPEYPQIKSRLDLETERLAAWRKDVEEAKAAAVDAPPKRTPKPRKQTEATHG